MSREKKECCDASYPDHARELSRLKKIEGQVRGVQKMIDDRRYCVDILQQLSAVKSAIVSLQSNLLETHLNYCVKDAFDSRDEGDIEKKILEIKELFKKQ